MSFLTPSELANKHQQALNYFELSPEQKRRAILLNLAANPKGGLTRLVEFQNEENTYQLTSLISQTLMKFRELKPLDDQVSKSIQDKICNIYRNPELKMKSQKALNSMTKVSEFLVSQKDIFGEFSPSTVSDRLKILELNVHYMNLLVQIEDLKAL